MLADCELQAARQALQEHLSFVENGIDDFCQETTLAHFKLHTNYLDRLETFAENISSKPEYKYERLSDIILSTPSLLPRIRSLTSKIENLKTRCLQLCLKTNNFVYKRRLSTYLLTLGSIRIHYFSVDSLQLKLPAQLRFTFDTVEREFTGKRSYSEASVNRVRAIVDWVFREGVLIRHILTDESSPIRKKIISIRNHFLLCASHLEKASLEGEYQDSRVRLQKEICGAAFFMRPVKVVQLERENFFLQREKKASCIDRILGGLGCAVNE